MLAIIIVLALFRTAFFFDGKINELQASINSFETSKIKEELVQCKNDMDDNKGSPR
jgi:hypothetical protein